MSRYGNRWWTGIVAAGWVALVACSLCRGAGSTDVLDGLDDAHIGRYSSNVASPDSLTTTEPGKTLKVTGGSAGPERTEDIGQVAYSSTQSSGATAVFTGRSTSWGCMYTVNGEYVGSGTGPVQTWTNKFKDKPRIYLEVNGAGDADNYLAVGGTATLTVTLKGGSAGLSYIVGLGVSPGGIVSLTPSETAFNLNGEGGTRTITLTGLAPGYVAFAVNCPDADPGTASASATVVGAAKIQWNNNGTWTDVPNPLVVAKGTTVSFKAIPNPSGATWPSGKPVWGGTSGASGTGETKDVTFNTTSSSTIDFKTVTAECGNTVTANVLVVEIDKLQWKDGDNWTDVTGTLTVAKGATVSFKAIAKPSGATWPSGKPVWGGTSGASGTGETKDVTFNTASSSTTDFKTVTAECGSTKTTNVIVFTLDAVTVCDKSNTNNMVTVNSSTAGHVYLRDPGSGVTINVAMTTSPIVSGVGQKVRWRVLGSTAAPVTGDFSSGVEIQLTPNPNRTFTVEVGCDTNSNGTLDSNEIARMIYVYLITVSSMTVSEHGTSSNSVTNPSDTSLVVAEDPVSGNTLIDLSASWLPGASGVAAHVLWTVTGASPAPALGNFGTAANPTIQLTGSDGDRTATVSVGVDGNANGILDTAEISYSVSVGVAKVVLTVENAGGAAGAVPLTECMAGRDVTFTATATDNFPCGIANPMCFTFHYEDPDGTLVTDDDWSTDRVEDNTRTIPDFTDTDGDHKYATPVYVVASNDSVSATSNTLNIDVYQLWIKTFKDTTSGKDWQVCIARDISYEAYASSDCESWSWDMPDGVPDAWNPTGGNAKSGSGMQIPNTDKARAKNSWFGDVYGTVYVFCEDGDGNNHSFYSTSMSPSKKAKVFFEKDTNVEGGTPSTDKPPAWFVFWNQTAAGNANATYDHNDTSFGHCNLTVGGGILTGVTGPFIGRMGASATTLGYGRTVGGAGLGGKYGRAISGIDSFRITILHETLHFDDFSASLQEPNPDSDYLDDGIEVDANSNSIYDAGETDPAMTNTHALSGEAIDYEYRTYWREANVWHTEVEDPSTTPPTPGPYWDVDWSFDGKQW